MMLQEKSVHEEAAEIENYVIDKINSVGYSQGSFSVTRQFNKFFKDNPFSVFVKYDLNAKKTSFETTGEDDKIYIHIFAKKNTSMREITTSINHEIIHAINDIQSNKTVRYSSKKNYKKFVLSDKYLHDYQLTYYKNKNEFNVVINQIVDNYNNNKYFRNKINNFDSLEEMLDFIYKYLQLGYVSEHAKKDVDFRRMFLKRLTREGVPLKFYKKQMFKDAVEKAK